MVFSLFEERLFIVKDKNDYFLCCFHEQGGGVFFLIKKILNCSLFNV